jgi:hypothetical protein
VVLFIIRAINLTGVGGGGGGYIKQTIKLANVLAVNICTG